MADLTSGDRPVDLDHGAIDGQQDRSTTGPAVPTDEQTLADREQTLADRDQTGSDSDQTAAESDQEAADQDQAASDLDLAQGSDPAVHELTRDLRDHNAAQRQQTAAARLDAAAVRDAVARQRDLIAAERDRVAELHDQGMGAFDAAWEGNERSEFADRGALNRRRAASQRAKAAEARARAAEDREQAARDREQAARDREQARAEYAALLSRLVIAETDAVTGACTRAAGLADLDREIDRARRTSGLLVVAYVDVVGLKAVNDAHGHDAGDALLRGAIRAIRGHLRSDSVIVRLGGDEFLCVMPGTRVDDARCRFAAIQAALAGDAKPSEIRAGFAALAPTDSAADLISRADAELPSNRRR